jgi:hypothetical protein
VLINSFLDALSDASYRLRGKFTVAKLHSDASC